MTALMPVRVGARSRRLGEARCVRERRGALSASSRRARSDGLEPGSSHTGASARASSHRSQFLHGFLFFACIKSLRNLAALLRYLFIGQGLYGYVCVTRYSVLIGIAIGLNMQYRLSQPRPRSCESRAFNI